MSYEYDTIGNMTYKSDIGNYNYGSQRPHAVTQAGNKNLVYDANGNMTNNNGQLITYTGFNKVASIKNRDGKHKTLFKYNVNKQRYKKVAQYENSTKNKTIHYYNGSLKLYQ